MGRNRLTGPQREAQQRELFDWMLVNYGVFVNVPLRQIAKEIGNISYVKIRYLSLEMESNRMLTIKNRNTAKQYYLLNTERKLNE